MSGTDVAEKDESGEQSEEQESKKRNTFLAFLRIWLPFPVILGGILFWQFRSGTFEKPEPDEAAPGGVFEGAGADLPLLLEALTEERGRLQKEWDDLRFAERRAFLEQSEIEGRKREVEELLSRVEATVQVMEEERGNMLEQLARVYETMKPDAAAEILSGVDVDTSTEIIRRMKERNAASVMASLEPRAAARISQRMLRHP